VTGLHYSIDTSALIHWWDEAYSPAQVPGLVPKLDALAAEGRLVAARSVKDEIAEGPLRTWCKQHTDFFIDEDEAIQLAAAALLAKYPVKARSIKGADPFVIALAQARATTEQPWAVVSAEGMRGPERGVSIPWVCNDHNVTHMSFFQMWKTEGWSV
jgi:hypothetical protein